MKNIKNDPIHKKDAEIPVKGKKMHQQYIDNLSVFRNGLSLESVTLSHTYVMYPYKKKGFSSTCFVKKDKADNTNEYSMDYVTYRKIIKCFFKHLKDYIVHGHPYRFASGIGTIQMKKYKPKHLGYNLPKAIKKIVKITGLPYYEAKDKINEYPEFLEERRNLKLKGYKFQIFWNKYNPVANLNAWGVKIVSANSVKDNPYKEIMKYYQNNPDVFDKLPEHIYKNTK